MESIAKPSAEILELPLSVRAEMAFQAAVQKVIINHMRSGQPIHIWRDGKVVEVSAQELKETVSSAPSADTTQVGP
jgi:hypothetical protein